MYPGAALSPRLLVQWLAAVAIASKNVAAAELPLDRIDACEELRDAATWIASTTVQPPSSCRPAHGPIEEAIRAVALQGSAPVCFLRSSTRLVPETFQCLRFDTDDAASLVCYRPFSASIVTDYMRDYKERYSQQAAAYLARAGKCSVSNGDASVAPAGLFPQILTYVGRQQFAYISLLGKTDPPNAAAIHGFAIASPAVRQQGIEAFEYFSVYQSKARLNIDAQQAETIESWRLLSDELKNKTGEIEKLYLRLGVSVQIRVALFEVERDLSARPYTGTLSPTAEAAELLTAKLLADDFEEASSADLKQVLGPDGSLVNHFRSLRPFGGAPIEHFGSNWRGKMFVKRTNEECTHARRGAFAVQIIYSDGVSGQKDRYGNLMVMAEGMGQCGVRSAEQIGYLDTLMRESREALVTALIVIE